MLWAHWLIVAMSALLGAWMAVIALGVATLWYAPVGTAMAIVVIALSVWTQTTG